MSVTECPHRARFIEIGTTKRYNEFTTALMLTKRVKTKVIKEHQVHERDTGSAPVQIGMLTREIDELTAHLKKHPKDNHSRRGLLKMVSQRRRLLRYLERHEPKNYEKILKQLDLKK